MSGIAVEFAGCVWTEAESQGAKLGTKKWGIQNYPDNSGRGLKMGVHMKTVLTSVNTAFLPISRSRFK